ncbi:hypothetical protein [Chondromyces crocatus]|uniref:Uncharacterized protein n=1 Tax=Chondromyces crocatus TaxID=52 RepID=A0A0K1EBB8_CHOCO|nr:hypothetical protein [Chondromyces crocatus]AKT38139.1 uncharacterized protein CMC5_022810 [Chondromyces crocatus]
MPPPRRPACPNAQRTACFFGVAALAAAVITSCGARTSLLTEDDSSGFGAGGPTSTSGLGGAGGVGGGGGPSTSTGPTCRDDSDCDDGIACTIDLCQMGNCVHTSANDLCDDGRFCTLDRCDPFVGCLHEDASATLCDDGIACTIDVCDDDAAMCLHEACDGRCNNNLFCDGVERCDTAIGCVAGPPACSLGLGCGTSTCQESNDTCAHVLPPGCAGPDVHLLVADNQGNLVDVAPYAATPPVILAHNAGLPFLDIAVMNGRWFAVTTHFVELAPYTTQVIATHDFLSANSLGAGPDGMLYAAGDLIYRLHPNTGASQVVGSLPPGHTSSGDLAFLGNRMFISTDSGCGSTLVEFNLATGQSTVLGGDGLGCVYGLAPAGDRLFILNCNGKVGTFHPDTGEVNVFTTNSLRVYGADILP